MTMAEAAPNPYRPYPVRIDEMREETPDVRTLSLSFVNNEDKEHFPGWSPGCYIQGRNGIRVGSNLRLGPNVGLISANHDLSDYDAWPQTPPISIGDNVWIGMNAVVLPGVSIGSNCVVGANSVVTKDIPPNCVASGNPCKVIREKPPYAGVQFNE